MHKLTRSTLSVLLLICSLSVVAQTQPGWEASAKVSHYDYKEPGFMGISGPLFGIGAEYTHQLEKNSFLRLDGTLMAGFLDYEGSGNLNNTENFYGDIRAFYQRDLILESGLNISPYVGLGYRFLYNDLRGATTTGAGGYRRLSNYIYLPLGLKTQTVIAGHLFDLNAELGVLLRGYQKSNLSDFYSNVTDVTNEQKTGQNFRLSALYKFGQWSAGPYYNHWWIGNSQLENGYYEPKNTTTEFGLTAKYRY